MLCGVKALVAGACGIIAATVAIAAGAAAKPASGASCPFKPGGSPSGGDVQWSFSETGPPSGKHNGVKSSYTHGLGNWTKGRTTGKACSQDSLTSGPSRNLVLSAAGKAKLTGRVTQSGLLGVRLVLPLRVSASDDSGCVTGTRGTATLFASYFAVHRDTVSLHFPKACADHDHRFGGSRVHVFIARHNAQVNTP